MTTESDDRLSDERVRVLDVGYAVFPNSVPAPDATRTEVQLLAREVLALRPLRAEVERLRKDAQCDGNTIARLRNEIEYLRAALAAQPATAQADAREQLIAIAEGCHDFGGGYHGDDAKMEAFQHGISTVVNALSDTGSFQRNVLERVGRAARRSPASGEAAKPTESRAVSPLQGLGSDVGSSSHRAIHGPLHEAQPSSPPTGGAGELPKAVEYVGPAMPCGHPRGCYDSALPSGKPGCGWCADLLDLSMVMDHASLVFDHVTGGRISKPNTLPSEVIGQADERVQEAIDEAIKEDRELQAESPPPPRPRACDDALHFRAVELSDHLLSADRWKEDAWDYERWRAFDVQRNALTAAYRLTLTPAPGPQAQDEAERIVGAWRESNDLLDIREDADLVQRIRAALAGRGKP